MSQPSHSSLPLPRAASRGSQFVTPSFGGGGNQRTDRKSPPFITGLLPPCVYREQVGGVARPSCRTHSVVHRIIPLSAVRPCALSAGKTPPRGAQGWSGHLASCLSGSDFLFVGHYSHPCSLHHPICSYPTSGISRFKIRVFFRNSRSLSMRIIGSMLPRNANSLSAILRAASLAWRNNSGSSSISAIRLSPNPRS